MSRLKPNRQYGTGLSTQEVETVRQMVRQKITERPSFPLPLLVSDLKDSFPNGTLKELTTIARQELGSGALPRGKKTLVVEGSVITVYSIVCDCGKVHKIIAERF